MDKIYKTPKLEWEENAAKTGMCALSPLKCRYAVYQLNNGTWVHSYSGFEYSMSIDSLEHGQRLCEEHFHNELVKAGFVEVKNTSLFIEWLSSTIHFADHPSDLSHDFVAQLKDALKNFQ